MLMKDGTKLPPLLTDALAKDTYALKVFMEMSITYQNLYVNQLKNTDYGSSMRERLERTVRDICKFGKDRGIK